MPNVVNMKDQSEEESLTLNEKGLLYSDNNKNGTINKQVSIKTNVWQKILNLKSNITVEPSLACFVMPSVFTGLATQNLNLEKACRVNLNYSDEVCTALKIRQTENYTSFEANVQTLVASTQAWKSIMHTALPAILLLFIGAWSDKTGKRKICILMPIVGEFLACLCNILSTYFFHEISVETTVFLETIFPAITGGWSSVFLGVFSYIGDITSNESRTFRVGLVNMCMSVGIPIGMGLSGVLLRIIGYYGVFIMAAIIYFLNFIYTCFVLVDPSERITMNKEKELTKETTPFFDMRHVKNTWSIVLKKGPNNRRIKVSMLLIAACLIFGPMWGELTVMYLFTRYRFKWDEVSYSLYSTYSITAHTIGTLFSISFFSRYLQLDDSVLGMISTSSKILGAFILAFARTECEIFLAPLVEILNGTSFIALRSIASKLVSSEELGKMNSLYGLAEAMMPLVFGPLYSRVYVATLASLPGAVFLLGAAVTIPALFIFMWLFYDHRSNFKKVNSVQLVSTGCHETTKSRGINTQAK